MSTTTSAAAPGASGKDNQHLSPKSDIEISQAAKMRPIVDVARNKLGIPAEHIQPYGHYKGKISLDYVTSLEGKPDGIRVNSVSPGAVATPMWESTGLWPNDVAQTGGREAALKALVEKQGFAQPEEIAAAVLFLASDEARHITGVDLPVDAGFSVG